MSAEAFEQLRELVLADEELVARLAPLDRVELTETLVGLAIDQGLAVREADVDDAFAAARREWLERWI